MTGEMGALALPGRHLGIVVPSLDLPLETALNVDRVRGHAYLFVHEYLHEPHYVHDLSLHPAHSVEQDRGSSSLVVVGYLSQNRYRGVLTHARGPQVHDPAHGRILTFVLAPARLRISLADVARAEGDPFLAIASRLLQTVFTNQRMKDDLGLDLLLLPPVLRLPLHRSQPQ